MPWHIGLGLCLQCQHCIWALVHVPVVPLPMQLPANSLGKQQMTREISSRENHMKLLAPACPSAGCCSHVGSEAAERNPSLLLSL